MRDETFTNEEVSTLSRTCQWVGLDGLRPLTLAMFRAFLVGKLEGRDQGLADKVAVIPEAELDALHRQLRGRQSLAHSLVYG